jgi:hypothetical protein
MMEHPMTEARPKTNGYADTLTAFVEAIDHEHDALDTLKSEYMTACKGPRSRIKQTLKSARESDINMGAFRELLAKHLSDRKHDKRLAELEADELEAYNLMVDALGEYAKTPLGEAALARVRPKKGRAELDV